MASAASKARTARTPRTARRSLLSRHLMRRRQQRLQLRALIPHLGLLQPPQLRSLHTPARAPPAAKRVTAAPAAGLLTLTCDVALTALHCAADSVWVMLRRLRPPIRHRWTQPLHPVASGRATCLRRTLMLPAASTSPSRPDQAARTMICDVAQCVRVPRRIQRCPVA